MNNVIEKTQSGRFHVKLLTRTVNEKNSWIYHRVLNFTKLIINKYLCYIRGFDLTQQLKLHVDCYKAYIERILRRK